MLVYVVQGGDFGFSGSLFAKQSNEIIQHQLVMGPKNVEKTQKLI